ncbi:MAG: hypothetical protein HFJ27_05005 [Clostridia bacterium]|nr:hypothetical protein [Clostridia bacterium]
MKKVKITAGQIGGRIASIWNSFNSISNNELEYYHVMAKAKSSKHSGRIFYKFMGKVSVTFEIIWQIISTIFQAIWNVISIRLTSIWNIFSQM